MNETVTVPGSEPVVPAPPPAVPAEETLVADARAGLTPAQFVERKLVALLQATPLPVSHLQTARVTRR
jgi:hypothetical protein